MASDEQSAARKAVLNEITRQASATEKITAWNADRQAEIIRDLALAYRYVSGGTQPGAVVVESK